MIEYSIIIPYHSNINLLSLCVSSLSRTLDFSEAEIIIVDNNAYRSDLAMDLSALPNCKVLRIKENLLYPRAVNIGAKSARGKYLLFCDADICVTNNFHKKLTSVLSTASVGFSSAKLLNTCTGRIEDFGIACSHYNFPHPFAGRKSDWILAKSNHYPMAACSACSAIRHDIFDAIGGFDECLLHSYSDIDLCIRIRDLGYKTVCVSDVEVYHQGASTRGSGMSRNLKEDTKGIFFSKHPNIQTDITDYLAQSCVQLKYEEKLHEREYFLLNLSTIGNPYLYIDFVKEHLNIIETAHVHLPVSKRDTDHIHLLDFVPHVIRNYHIPILYFVDRFTALDSNKLWNLCREQYADIVVDRNANVLFLGTQ